MNPLELVSKTLYSFGEKHLTVDLLNAFGKQAISFQQYNDIAKIFFELKYFEYAILYGEKSLKDVTNEDEKCITIKNLINAYNQSNYPEKSLEKIEYLNETYREDFELILEHSFAFSALNQKDKSYELLFELLKHKLPSEIKKKAYHNLSGYYFRQDNLHDGLKHFLRVGEDEAYKNKKKLPYEKWDGSIVSGRTIIIDNECGAGDEVIHVRFMKTLRDLGMNPIWLTTRRELAELFNYNGFQSECVFDNPTFPSDSCWVYSLALPYYLNLTVHELGTNPYLKTEPNYDKKWDWLKEDKKFKIGLFWASSSGFEQNCFRSVNLDGYMKVLSDYDCSLYSLQTFNENEDANEYPQIKQNLSVKGREYADTFSIINNLDLVVTSCSFVAHVAASLGKEVCVFTPIMEYYIWTSSNNYSWWYGDNVHLFKQTKPRCWEEPLEKFKQFISNL